MSRQNRSPVASFSRRTSLGSAGLTVTLALGAIACTACSAARPAPAVAEQAAEEPEAPQDERYAALPVPGAAGEWAPPRADKSTLDNGLSVWNMNHGSAPLVSIHLVLPSGGARDSSAKAGLTLLAADLLDEGAGEYDALELNDRLGELATDYGAQAGVDYVMLSMNALAENVDESLKLLADIVLRPRLSKEEFERRKEHYRASALSAQDSPRHALQVAIKRVLFGDGYAGSPVTGTVDSIASLGYQETKARAKSITVPDGAHLVVAGASDAKATQALVKKYFGAWKGKRPKSVSKIAVAPTGGTAYVVDFKGAAQSALSVVTRAGTNTDPNYFAEEVMHQKLGGSFDGRINLNLREDKGYTYGARSSFSRYHQAGYFEVTSLVKQETTGDSVSEIFKELKDVCGERPLSAKEVESGISGMLLGYPLDFDKVHSVGYRLASLPVRSRPVDFWSTWPTQVKSITTQRANEAAKPYCDPSKYSVVVAGDLAAIEAPLKKLGLKIQVLDRTGKPVSGEKKD